MKKIRMMMALVMAAGLMTMALSGCGSSVAEVNVPEQTEDIIEEETYDDTEEEIEEEVYDDTEEVTEEEPVEDTEDEADVSDVSDEAGMPDLFDYYKANIDHVATDLPDLKYDDSYKNSEDTTEISAPTDTMETMSDGIALAGPFFSVDREGTVVGISYGGRKYSVCGITMGMPMSEAAEIAKSHGFNFSNVEITHGSAKYVAVYDNGEAQLCITSDADGEFGKTEESDVTGNVDDILLIAK